MKPGTLGLILAGIAAPAVAVPDGALELHDPKRSTPVSGYAGLWADLGADNEPRALHSIAWGEKAGDPCSLVITATGVAHDSPAKRHVFGGLAVDANAREPSREGAHPPQRVRLDCDANLKEVSTPGGGEYLYKLSVCTTDARDRVDNRLKGIRIWSRALRHPPDKSGTASLLADTPAPYTADHPQCERWHAPVACAAGEIATGARVHYNDWGKRRWITGLSLICRAIKRVS